MIVENPGKSRKIHYLYIDGTKKANPCVGGARRDLDRGPDARCEPRGVSFGSYSIFDQILSYQSMMGIQTS